MKISTFAPEFFAQVAELVDALDSKSSVLNRRAGSIPALGTIENQGVRLKSGSFFILAHGDGALCNLDDYIIQEKVY